MTLHSATLSRRSLVLGAIATGVGATLVGCGDDDDDASGATAATGEFPVTMKHRFGTTTVKAAPERVVTAGFNDADFALALGVVPVAVGDFIGEFAEERRSWARAALGGANPPKVSGSSGELNFEAIAAQRPDLIVFYNYLERNDYQQLAKIAPTVVEPKVGTLWPQHTVDVGRALGRSTQAKAKVKEVRAHFAEAREAHPELAGKTAAIYFDLGEPGKYFVLEPDDARTGLFTSLGLKMPERTGEISREEVGALDQDVLVVIGKTKAQMAGDKLFQALDVVKEDRVAYLGDYTTEFAGAWGFDSPLSLPTAVDEALPALSAAARNVRS